MYFGTYGSDANYVGGGGLNVCAADGTYANGLCSTTTGFTNTFSNEGGKVLVSATSAAGGFTAGAVSDQLMKACVTNGAAVPTGGNLANML